MFRELRRKSLQLERGALEKFRPERRGSLSDKSEKNEKTSTSSSNKDQHSGCNKDHHHSGCNKDHHHSGGNKDHHHSGCNKDQHHSGCNKNHHSGSSHHHHHHHHHNHHDKSERRGSLVIRWFRHIQEAQDAYTAREGRNRRPQPPVSLPDPDDQPASSADALRDVDDAVDIDGGDGADGSNDVSADSKALHGSSKTQEQTPKSEESFISTSTAGQTPSSPDTLSKKTEHLRRKDLKIRQALEEKQHIIADILNIPHEHFENVVDMAGEPAVGNKEPRELVLAAMFQAKCLQETLNEALNIGEGDIVAARANNDGANKASNLPLYQAPMTKLMSISTSLSQQFASLLSLISERDDERERMRKELVALREQLHLLHMRQNSNQPASITTSVSQPIAASPHTSRPSSFVSVASSTADHSDTPDHHDTDEENRNDVPKVNSLPPTECEDSKDDVVPETFEDAVSGGEQTEAASRETEASTGGGGGGGQGCSEGIGSRESESNTEVTTTT